MRKVIVAIQMDEASDCYQIRRSHQEGWFWINKDHPAIQDVTITRVPWTDGDIVDVQSPMGRAKVIVRIDGAWYLAGSGYWGNDSHVDARVDSGHDNYTVIRKQADQ